MQISSLGQEDPLEKEMATHSSIYACEIPWTEEPGGLQSMGSQRVVHNYSTLELKVSQNCNLCLRHQGKRKGTATESLKMRDGEKNKEIKPFPDSTTLSQTGKNNNSTRRGSSPNREMFSLSNYCSEELPQDMPSSIPLKHAFSGTVGPPKGVKIGS